MIVDNLGLFVLGQLADKPKDSIFLYFTYNLTVMLELYNISNVRNN